MTFVRNGRHIFKEIATGYPIPGKTTLYDGSQTIDLENVPLNGGALVKVLYLSIDPYLRFRMRDPTKFNVRHPFQVDEPLQAYGLGVVLRTDNPSYAVGDHVTYGGIPHQEYFVAPKEMTQLVVMKNEENLPWSLYLGVLGMPGLTAYAGWKHFAKPKKGDTLFVTTAAGPVGATVVQLAKADGLRVIGSAGSTAKVDFLKSIGIDVAFNYKEQDTREVLKKEGPIDIYWDNVGGDIFDAFLENSTDGAIAIVCGSMAGYNGIPNPVLRHNLLFERNITVYGFRYGRVAGTYEEAFLKEMPKAIASGRFKYREHIVKGLENASQALADVQLGKNEGKSIIEVAVE